MRSTKASWLESWLWIESAKCGHVGGALNSEHETGTHSLDEKEAPVGPAAGDAELQCRDVTAVPTWGSCSDCPHWPALLLLLVGYDLMQSGSDTCTEGRKPRSMSDNRFLFIFLGMEMGGWCLIQEVIPLCLWPTAPKLWWNPSFYSHHSPWHLWVGREWKK